MSNEFQWTDELVLMALDLAHHNGYHRWKQTCKELFDEVKYQAQHGGYKYAQWITDHLKPKPDPHQMDIQNAIAMLVADGYEVVSPNAKKSKPDIFTTEDGFLYYEYQQKNIYCLHTGTSHWHPDKHVSYTKELHVYYNKFFSTKEAAEEYIKMNKPLNLSMKEIASCVTDVLDNPGPGVYVRARTEIDLDKLDALIKSKL